MWLGDYLREKEIRVHDFASKIGVERQTVYSYLRREKRPSDETYEQIFIATDGLVTPNDFHDLDLPATPPTQRNGGKHA